MINFIKVNMSSILVALFCIAGLLFAYKNGNIDFVRKVVLSLVVKAEKTLGSGTGELKYAMVIEEIYITLPSIIRFLVSEKELDEMIENSVKYLKRYLSDGKDLLGYEDEYMKMLRMH